MTYIFIYFIPGAAGNFLARSLNLLKNFHCFVDENQPLPLDLDEKMSLLSYQQVIDINRSQRDWVNFEISLKHYSQTQYADRMPADSRVIWWLHPNFDMNERSWASVNDHSLLIYIDPSKCFEWCMLNAMYKNSWIDSRYLEAAKFYESSQDVVKIDLSNILVSFTGFIQELDKICQRLDYSRSQDEVNALHDLYQQWLSTTLPPDQFESFKKQIGWYNT
jgi:hypothetical protein